MSALYGDIQGRGDGHCHNTRTTPEQDAAAMRTVAGKAARDGWSPGELREMLEALGLVEPAAGPPRRRIAGRGQAEVNR